MSEIGPDSAALSEASECPLLRISTRALHNEISRFDSFLPVKRLSIYS